MEPNSGTTDIRNLSRSIGRGHWASRSGASSLSTTLASSTRLKARTHGPRLTRAALRLALPASRAFHILIEA